MLPFTPAATACRFRGVLGQYVDNVTEQWLKVAPWANPGMLEIFRDRDRLPRRDMVPWAGEFAGKYLTGAVAVLRMTGDEELRRRLETFVAELVSLQADNGYLGPWPSEAALTNHAPQCANTWDTWGHYHLMLGLLAWRETTGDAAALWCARRAGDLMCEMYLGDTEPRLAETGSTEMNLAPAHSLCLLYRRTGEQRYLDLARQIVDREFTATDDAGRPLAGDYLRGPLSGREFFELPRPRWESLHPILAMAELYDLTGERAYRDAFERIWWSIVRGDRHNNGGFTSGERAVGDPYHPGAIETCCTIAWSALGETMLHLTGDSRVADELELTLLNSVLGMHNATGRWATYDTPMDGVRRASAHSIVFQAREGTPELNCCSVNSARGFGLLSGWAMLRGDDGELLVNAYASGEMTAELADGGELRIVQQTDYPYDNVVRLAVHPSRPAELELKLRIPQWSRETRVSVNGEAVENVQPGEYLPLRRRWSGGDAVELTLDFTPHFWAGRGQCAGRTSVYRGPILLTWDRRYNATDPEQGTLLDTWHRDYAGAPADALPALDAANLEFRPAKWTGWLPPAMLLEAPTADGGNVRLCDFGSAGAGGSPYRSWLNVPDAASGRRSPFVPSEAAHLRNAVGQFLLAVERRDAARRELERGGDPNALLGVLRELQDQAEAFIEALGAARRLRDEDPDAADAELLREAIDRARAAGLDHGDLLERFQREEAALRRQPGLANPECDGE